VFELAGLAFTLVSNAIVAILIQKNLKLDYTKI
jgi:hypothetical protein